MIVAKIASIIDCIAAEGKAKEFNDVNPLECQLQAPLKFLNFKSNPFDHSVFSLCDKSSSVTYPFALNTVHILTYYAIGYIRITPVCFISLSLPSEQFEAKSVARIPFVTTEDITTFGVTPTKRATGTIAAILA